MFRKLFILFSLFFLMTGCSSKTIQTELPKKGEKIAVLNTESGQIKIRLFPKVTPKAVENFTKLIEQKKYNGNIFHRVVPNFVIQAGDFENKDGTGGYSWQGEGTEIEDEITEELKHIKGSVAMAKKGGAKSYGSQFYISVVDNHFLDGEYTIFGQVFEGMDTVEKISKLRTNGMGQPQLIKNMKTYQAEQKALIKEVKIITVDSKQ